MCARILLSDVARIEEIIGPRQITRQNGQRFITVQCNVDGRDIGGLITSTAVTLLTLPALFPWVVRRKKVHD